MQTIKYFKDIDFIKIFDIQHKETIFKPKSKEDWDNKAKSFNQFQSSLYYYKFLSKININEIESVFDVGCGNGNLALKFLEKGKKVVGLDYSDGMLKIFKENTKNYKNVKAIKKAWEEDWSDVDICDIAVVSKSFEFENLSVRDAIEKLNAHVKKRVYLTYYVGNYLDDEIIDFIGKEIVNRPEYILLLDVLYQMGIKAKLDFIMEEGIVGDLNFEEFLQFVEWKIGELNSREIEKLKKYYHLKKSKDKPLFKPMKWAFISWEK